MEENPSKADPAVALSLVVPVYNEQETLPYSHARLINALMSSAPLAGLRIEIIYVNDGSKDESARILREFVKSESIDSRMKIRAVMFSRNFGHSAAVLAGLEAAVGEKVCIIDADLQDPPELIGEMFQKCGVDADVVYGQRVSRDGETWAKRMTAWLFYRTIQALAGFVIPKDTGDFRVMTKEVRDALTQCSEQEPFLRGLVAWVGFRQQAFPYQRQSRKFGETKYPWRRMFRFAFNAILSFSQWPLRLCVMLGAGGLALSLILSAWALTRHLQGATVAGWTSLLIVFLFLQSLVLFMLGVVSLYVGVIHKGVQARPRYILAKNIE